LIIFILSSTKASRHHQLLEHQQANEDNIVMTRLTKGWFGDDAFRCQRMSESVLAMFIFLGEKSERKQLQAEIRRRSIEK